VLAKYIAHAWMAAIALGWFFLLGRRFPIGSFTRRMRPWYIAAIVLIAVSVGETIASRPSAGFHVPALPTLVAQLVFLAFVVGPTEELLFRGLIQTGLRQSLGRWGIVIGALLFGFSPDQSRVPTAGSDRAAGLDRDRDRARFRGALRPHAQPRRRQPGAQRRGLLGRGHPLVRVFSCQPVSQAAAAVGPPTTLCKFA